MNTILYLIVLIGLGFIATLVYLYVHGRGQETRHAAQRLQRSAQATAQPETQPTEPHSRERQLLPTLEKFLFKARLTERLLDDLSRAGWRIKPSEYVGASLGLMSVVVLFIMILTQNLLLSLVLGLAGLALPRLLLSAAIGRRKKAFEAQIPDMVMLIISALKSGYSFLRALQVAAQELPPPISEMSKRLVAESQLGVPLQEALQRMAVRVQSYDMDLIATAVTIQSQVGGSLAEVLEAIGETIRDRIQIQSEVSSLTAEGRLSGIILLLLTPVLGGVLTIMNPAYILSMFHDPMGIKMIVGMAGLQLVGIYWIKKMLKIAI
ncbi:MAG: type II secretion system F family protein [Armatimonadota bacterium]